MSWEEIWLHVSSSLILSTGKITSSHVLRSKRHGHCKIHPFYTHTIHPIQLNLPRYNWDISSFRGHFLAFIPFPSLLLPYLPISIVRQTTHILAIRHSAPIQFSVVIAAVFYVQRISEKRGEQHAIYEVEHKTFAHSILPLAVWLSFPFQTRARTKMQTHVSIIKAPYPHCIQI